MTSTNQDDDAVISAAARLFRAALASEACSDPGFELCCLTALHHLGTPHYQPTDTLGLDPETLVREALRTLSTLPPAEFATPAILDASAAGRRALLRLSS
jgi:hypothetical protein